jgi:hypothetical protein
VEGAEGKGAGMIAYHGRQSDKSAILAQLQAHHDADEIIKRRYWKNGKGSAVGCTLHSSDHAEYEPRFGIPQMLAHLEETIFEGLPNDKAKDWPLRFMGAIRPGADLSLVGWKFLHWLLTDETVNPGINHPSVKDAVAQVAQVIYAISKGEPINKDAAESAAESAESAAWSAENAARSAAWSAVGSAESAAWSAAWSAVGSAESAAWSAENAAESAAWSAESAAWGAAETAKNAKKAKETAYIAMSDMLISLIEQAPLLQAAE